MIDRPAHSDGASPREVVRLSVEAMVELSRIARARDALIGGMDAPRGWRSSASSIFD
jgi:hypothetical protein